MENQLHLLTGAYALNAVTAAERVDFERHALGNPETLEEVRSLSQTAALLAYGTPAETPPPELKASVIAAIRKTRQLPAASVVRDIPSASSPLQGSTTARPRRAGPARRRWVPVLSAAAALVLLAGVGLGGWVMGQSASHKSLEKQVAEAQSQQAQQDALLAIMVSPDAKSVTKAMSDGGTVTVVSSSKANQAAVMASGLPALPSGKTYELWFISATGAVPAGLMPGTTGTAASLQVLDGALGGATHVGITVEPAGGSSKPTTTPILVQAI